MGTEKRLTHPVSTLGQKANYPLNDLVQGLSYEDYAADNAIRASTLSAFKNSPTPAHFVAAMEEEKEPSEALEFGKIFHSCMELGERFQYTIEPEFTGKTLDGRESTRSKAAAEKRAAWFADLKPGTVVLKKEQAETITMMLENYQKNSSVKKVCADGVKETSLWVKDPETGLILKCRPDLISTKDYLVDIKTTKSASDEDWLGEYGEIFGMKGNFYAMTMAHYVHCLRLAGVLKREAALLIAVEKTRPWGVRVFPLDSGALGVGEAWRAHYMRKLAKCINENKWPNYSEKAVQVLVPEWMKTPPEEEV